jgi:hypothetical protein
MVVVFLFKGGRPRAHPDNQGGAAPAAMSVRPGNVSGAAATAMTRCRAFNRNYNVLFLPGVAERQAQMPFDEALKEGGNFQSLAVVLGQDCARKLA